MPDHPGEHDLVQEVDRLRGERDRALVALWRIRMAAERSSLNDPVWALPSEVISIALGGMGHLKHQAQEMAAHSGSSRGPDV